MAAVTQCDVCSNVMKNDESKYVKVNRCTSDGKLGNVILEKDLCPQCYEKLCKILKTEVK